VVAVTSPGLPYPIWSWRTVEPVSSRWPKQVATEGLTTCLKVPGREGGSCCRQRRRPSSWAARPSRPWTSALHDQLPWRRPYTGDLGSCTRWLLRRRCSILLAAGESVVAVAERLGHEDATLVLKTYGHLMPDSEDRTRRAIDAAWVSDGPGTDGGDRPQTSFLVSN
jgi:hypothetical protein